MAANRFKLICSRAALLPALLLASAEPLGAAGDPEINLPKAVLSNVPFTVKIEGLERPGATSPDSGAAATLTGYLDGRRIALLSAESGAELAEVRPLEGVFEAKLKVAGSGNLVLQVESGPARGEGRTWLIPGILSICPPLLAIVLALLTRQVLLSLVLGLWMGVTFTFHYRPLAGLMRTLADYLPQALGDPSHGAIILFSTTLGGMVAILARNGGTPGIVDAISRRAKTPVSGQIAAWFMGLVIFFDDYANTLLVGNSMRPLTDKLRLSREKLSYIVDSTAAPVSSLALISTWIGFEVGLLDDTFRAIQLDANGYFTFIRALPFNYYSIFCILMVPMIALLRRDFGPMLTAERRARETGQVLAEGAMPLADLDSAQLTPPPGKPRRWINALAPILVTIAVTIVGLLYSGLEGLKQGGETGPYQLYRIIGASDPFETLMWAAVAGSLTAGVLARVQGILSLSEIVAAWLVGVKSMVLAMIFLVLAWSLGQVCTDLHTADYIIQLASGVISPGWLPLIAFLIAASISFSIGTSWGTMAILIPIIIPLGYSLPPAAGLPPGACDRILLASIASVLSGATMGDHCSPLSDTTIMSSMASGADHIDHVRTQSPYALSVGIVSCLVGYAPIGLWAMPLAVSLAAGLVALAALVLLLGKPVDRVRSS